MGSRRIVVSNSTPLINFAAIRRLDILEKLFGKICVPKAVEMELMVKGKHYPSKAELQSHWSKLVVVSDVVNTNLSRALRLNLDDGEA